MSSRRSISSIFCRENIILFYRVKRIQSAPAVPHERNND